MANVQDYADKMERGELKKTEESISKSSVEKYADKHIKKPKRAKKDEGTAWTPTETN